MLYTTSMEKNVLNYRIIIEKEQYEDGSDVYVAYCPKLGVCDYGDSPEEVLASIKEGIELVIELSNNIKSSPPNNSVYQ